MERRGSGWSGCHETGSQGQNVSRLGLEKYYVLGPGVGQNFPEPNTEVWCRSLVIFEWMNKTFLCPLYSGQYPQVLSQNVYRILKSARPLRTSMPPFELFSPPPPIPMVPVPHLPPPVPPLATMVLIQKLGVTGGSHTKPPCVPVCTSAYMSGCDELKLQQRASSVHSGRGWGLWGTGALGPLVETELDWWDGQLHTTKSRRYGAQRHLSRVLPLARSSRSLVLRSPWKEVLRAPPGALVAGTDSWNLITIPCCNLPWESQVKPSLKSSSMVKSVLWIRPRKSEFWGPRGLASGLC